MPLNPAFARACRDLLNKTTDGPAGELVPVFTKHIQVETFQEAKRRRKSEQCYIKKQRKANPTCAGCDNDYERTGEYNTIHHLKPIREGGTHKDGLVTLCPSCHKAIHTVDGRFSYSHINAELTQLYQSMGL